MAAVNRTPPMKPPLVPPTPTATQEQSHAMGMKGAVYVEVGVEAINIKA